MAAALALKIFVVEDSRIIRSNLTETLEENAPVTVVGSAEDEDGAIAWLQANPQACDLVIVDIFLKSGTGLGVLKRIGRQPNAPRRVVFSNHSTPDIRAKCMDLGAEAVFDKSNEIEQLLAWFNRPVPALQRA